MLVVIPDLGDLLVPWPGASPVSLTAPGQGHRHSLQIPHPRAATASWAHTLTVETGVQGFALFSPSLRLYLEEGNQKSPHFPTHPLQPPYKEESREKLPIYSSGRCDLIALAQQE